MELCSHGVPYGVGCMICDTDGSCETQGWSESGPLLTRDQLLRTVQFRGVEIEYKGHWLRLDATCFFEWLSRKCPKDLTFNAQVVGFIVRIKPG